MLNAQELYCFLQDYVLKNPQEDQWQSFQSPITVFLDCWSPGKVTFEVGDVFKTFVDGTTVIEMKFNPREEYPLEILCRDFLAAEDEAEWTGDSYKSFV